jgi:DNA-binding NtrC family response regulator
MQHTGPLISSSGGTMSTNNKRVLVVDDEVNVADTLVLILQVFGFEAIAAYSGQEAVTTAQQFKPDAAILDVVMEHLSGIDAGVLISEMFPKCSVVLFSGQNKAAEMLQRANADGYNFPIFAKPVHPQLFLDYLRDLPSAAAPNEKLD